jgi:hypothetical protein
MAAAAPPTTPTLTGGALTGGSPWYLLAAGENAPSLTEAVPHRIFDHEEPA